MILGILINSNGCLEKEDAVNVIVRHIARNIRKTCEGYVSDLFVYGNAFLPLDQTKTRGI
jgi:hypothetical protein